MESSNFFSNQLDTESIKKIISNSLLRQSDGGELFLEFTEHEYLNLENGILKHSDFNRRNGFGLRSFFNDSTSLIHSSEVNVQQIQKAINTMEGLIKIQPKNSIISLDNPSLRKNYYNSLNPLNDANFSFSTKLSLLKEIESYAKAQDPSITCVKLNLTGKFQTVQIIKFDGTIVNDLRPLVRMDLIVILEREGKIEQGYAGLGGRYGYKHLFTNWEQLVDKAIKQANIKLEAKPAPAGEMTVVLGSGWPGVLVHEAVGHGLEGDFNRKKISVFASLLGKQVAAKGITIIDDGTIENARGSINVDDEGNPGSRNILIEDGILVKYMQDAMNASLMGVEVTGNGRRQDYASQTIPRMTNTFIQNGNIDPADIIKSVKKGLYAANFGGGQVDITSGKFVFSASEAYLIENGKITTPVKGATLIGNGPEILKEVSMVGNDLRLDSGIGTCSKDGQDLPVGVGQPTLRIDSITVGGTQI